MVWSPPSPGWIKINIDGAPKGKPRPIGYGGVACDHNGRFVVMELPLGTYTNQYIEAMITYIGVKLSNEKQ